MERIVAIHLWVYMARNSFNIISELRHYITVTYSAKDIRMDYCRIDYSRIIRYILTWIRDEMEPHCHVNSRGQTFSALLTYIPK